jgi:protein ImuB
MRIACVYAPQIALQAVLRRDPELRENALALADAKGERARIVGFTRAAYRAGVRLGMTVCQARTMAAGQDNLRVLPSSPADTAAAQAALADVGYGFAPRVQSENDRVFFEVGDLRRLFPSEQALAQGVTAQAARVGLAVRVAIAASLGVARVASRAQDIAIVPTGGEAAFLSPLPIRMACTDEDLTGDLETRLSRWGIRSLGALARLPKDAVVLRLGKAGARLWQLAQGCDEEPFFPVSPPDAVEEGTEIDYPICELEPLAFVLRSLLDRAMTRLQGRGLGCAGLTLRFRLDPSGFEVRQVPLAAPSKETGPLLELVRLALARQPPSAPVVGVTLLVLPARVRAVQLDLLRPSGPAPERLAATLARLAALVGIENLGAPAETNSFREEAVALRSYQNSPDPVANQPAPAWELAFRRFRPPQELEIIMGRQGPTALRGKATTARILMAAGPYRASGEWWSGEGFSRDYWDVHASDGAVYRVHQDQQSGQWFLDGYYD